MTDQPLTLTQPSVVRQAGQTEMFFISRVYGDPVPQGSIKAFPFRRKDNTLGVTVTSDNPKLKEWRTEMAHEFRLTAAGMRQIAGVKASDPVFGGAVAAHYIFILPRLAKHPKTARGGDVGLPSTKPDLDKLQRAVNDSLKDAGVLFEDSQICEVSRAIKRYARIDERPGVAIEVHSL